MSNRPTSVTILSWVLMAAGVVGFVYHLGEFRPPHGFSYELVGVELVRVLAFVAGLFMLRARNWARWLAVFWIAFHVVVSMFHSYAELGMHLVILVIFAWLLFRENANTYFRSPGAA